MKKHEIDTLKEQLKNEKKVINSIKAVYKDALENINQKTESFYLQMLKIQLNLDDSVDLTPEKIAEMKSQMQSKIYQAQYQEQLKAQLEEGMKIIESGSYERIHAYLNNCYEDGFIGAMYSMHNQGVPLIIPIDASAVRKAVLLDSKISKGLYSKIVKDVNDLKRRIASEVSRGVAQAMPYSEIARNINNTSRIGLNKAFRIAKTEGHRITQASAYDAMKSAKEKGADVVKQWDATLDGKTRDSHRKLDGQIRELDEPFEVNGHEAMFPADFGRPEEDINCRCVCLQRARWALDDDELETLKERAAFHGLQVKDSKEFGHAKAKDFADFRSKYLKALEKDGKNGTMKLEDIQIFRSVGAKARNYDILDLQTGEHFSFAEGTKIQNVEVFAGSGTRKPFKKAQKYADRYGGDARDWQHTKGIGVVDYYGENRKAEVHWVQCKGIGKHEFFVKEWIE